MGNRAGWKFLRGSARGLFLVLTVCGVLPGSALAQQTGTAAPLTITTSSLPRGYASQAFHVQLEVQNGTTPYKWSLASGSLPKGLNLTEDGVLGGVPVEAGQFHFVVTVSDNTKPPQQRDQELTLQVLAPLLAKWDRYPEVSGQRIEGSLKVSNQTEDSFDLTVIILAVNETGRATALGYQHFTLEKNTIDKEIPVGENLPPGIYRVNADVVAEVAASNTIHRARLATNEPLQVVQGP
jgi:Putative Ig domain